MGQQIAFIKPDFWNDDMIAEFTSLEKLFYLYLLTNEYRNLIGFYKLPKRAISYQIGITMNEVNETLMSLQNKFKKIIYIDDYIFVKGLIKNQTLNSPKLIIAMTNQINALPEHFRHILLEEISLQGYLGLFKGIIYPIKKQNTQNIPYTYSIDKVSIPYTYSMDTVSDVKNTLSTYQESESESELYIIKEKSKNLTSPLTIDRINAETPPQFPSKPSLPPPLTDKNTPSIPYGYSMDTVSENKSVTALLEDEKISKKAIEKILGNFTSAFIIATLNDINKYFNQNKIKKTKSAYIVGTFNKELKKIEKEQTQNETPSPVIENTDEPSTAQVAYSATIMDAINKDTKRIPDLKHNLNDPYEILESEEENYE